MAFAKTSRPTSGQNCHEKYSVEHVFIKILRGHCQTLRSFDDLDCQVEPICNTVVVVRPWIPDAGSSGLSVLQTTARTKEDLSSPGLNLNAQYCAS